MMTHASLFPTRSGIARGRPVGFSVEDYVSNGLNQYVRIDPSTGAAFDTQYDGRGNITDDGPNSYVFDAINRLTSSPSQSVALSYDAADRLSKITGTGSRQFLYDGANLIAEYDSGAVLRRYVHGPGTDKTVVWAVVWGAAGFSIESGSHKA
ncbi:MAG: hypothetical protein GXP04_01595 [Alphaproteobacteria bacterium]|nr:hypothetical protein [Alphaproteobacteria bacterium]